MDDTAKTNEERRARVRFPTDIETVCQPGVGDMDKPWWPAKIRDLSRSGLGLIVGRKFELGALVTVEVEVIGDAKDQWRSLRSRVVRISPFNDEGEWSVGCELIAELRADELDALLHK